VDSIGTGIHSSLNRPIIPKLSYDMPSKSQSEPLHHYAPRDREDELADEGSCLPGGSVTAKDWQRMYEALRQRVTMSNTSSIHVYPLDPHYAYTKSYSKEDRKRFLKTQFWRLYISRNSCVRPHPGCLPRSLSYLLKNNVILPEENRGIEHLILCKSLPKLQQERQGHVRAVLSEQHRMARLKQMKIQDDAVDKLATFSALRSSGR
jgi:hypothetical protein